MDTGGASIGQLLIFLVIFAVIFYPWWRIFSKAGYSGWMALLIFIPLVNLVTLYYLALSDWPALRGSSKD